MICVYSIAYTNLCDIVTLEYCNSSNGPADVRLAIQFRFMLCTRICSRRLNGRGEDDFPVHGQREAAIAFLKSCVQIVESPRTSSWRIFALIQAVRVTHMDPRVQWALFALLNETGAYCVLMGQKTSKARKSLYPRVQSRSRRYARHLDF